MAGTLKYFNEKLEKLSPDDQAKIVDALHKKLGVSHITPTEERRKALYAWLESFTTVGVTTERGFIDVLFSKPPEEIVRIISNFIE